MPIEKADVLEVLGDMRLRNIRFSVGLINVNSTEYDRVADYIASGAITVSPRGGNFSLYFPQINTLKTRDGDPRGNKNVRTNLLHECTHIISDINEVNVSRLTDEATAYLAQFAYLLLLDPAVQASPIREPMANMMRQGMQLVEQYKLGKPAGQGAKIAQSDISDLESAIHAIPDYANIEKDKLAADGVALSTNQAEEFFLRQLSRLGNKLLDDLMAEDLKYLLTPKVRYVSHENYVTWDPELLTLFDLQASGGSKQKQAAQQKLFRIFLTIDQRNATGLLQRLLTLRKGDVVSERFHGGFPPQLKSSLLAALQLSR
jgi:hypothetical protein